MTPKQKLIKAIQIEINDSFDTMQNTSNRKLALRKIAELNAYERALTLVEQILPKSSRYYLMSDVKRWKVYLPMWDQGEIIEKQDGDYVKFTDYESERIAHEETRKRLEEALQNNKELQWEIDIVRRNHQKTKPWVEEVTAMAQKYQELVNDTKTKID